MLEDIFFDTEGMAFEADLGTIPLGGNLAAIYFDGGSQPLTVVEVPPLVERVNITTF